MELHAGDRQELVADNVDPFDGAESGCAWVFGNRQSGSLIRARPEDDGGLVALADLAPPPRKLRPIRYGDKLPSEEQHPLDILAGTLDKFPELGFLRDGCFEAPLGVKILDADERGDLARGFAKNDPGRVGSGSAPEFQVPHPGTGAAWNGVSPSSSVDSGAESSGGAEVPVTGMRKRRKTRERLEHFLEKLVGNMMRRQERMHEQLIEVIEKKERERILREETWKQEEMERTKRDEEARAQEMSRSSAIISLIQTVIGQEIKIPEPWNLPEPQNLPEQRGDMNCGSAQTEGDMKVCDSNSRRWPQPEMQALITIRSEVEDKVGKGLIWDEISKRMQEKGFKRSAKKCKEKWENMNKYYRKVVEGGKKRAEYSKTCGYFEKLERFYKNGSKTEGQSE